MNTRTLGISSRLARRLLVFVWAAFLVVATGAKADPVKTLVQDVLYRADGSVAHGSVTIRWSGFSTSAGEAVAAGEMTVATDANGGIAIPLIPNTGSSPSGSYYKVVIKLNDGTTSEEQWVVPAAASTTVAAIRAKVVPQAVAAQFVSRDYVDSALSKLSTTIPAAQVNADWNSTSGVSQLLHKPVLSAVASSGNYNDLKNAPAAPNLASPGAIGTVAPGMINATTVTAQNSINSQSPAVDIRAFGAVIDNTTPIDTALQNAINAAVSTTGEVLLPCAAGCYLQNPTTLTMPNPGGGPIIAIKLQGNLRLGSTFVTPDRMDLIGDGGAPNAQFQMAGPTASITAPQVYGAMGTAVSAGTQTFTPTFTGGTIANMPVNSAITIAGTTTCSIASITRTTATQNNVVATLSGACRIPAGTAITVAGVTDSSFNGSPMVAISDYPALTLTWTQTGSASTSSGGTITGFNEDSFESVRITAVAGSTVTATFTHAHSASDVWGMVAVAPAWGTMNHHGFENIRVQNNYGAGFWGEHIAFVSLKNMAFSELNYMASIPVEMASSWWFTIDRSSLLPTLGHTGNCAFGSMTCTTPQGYPYALRLTALSTVRNSQNDGSGGEMSFVQGNTVIGGGIKIDTNQISQSMGGLKVSDTTIEQPISAVVMLDVRNPLAIEPVTLNNVFLQDGFMWYMPSYVNTTDLSLGKSFSAFIHGMSTVMTSSAAGKYFAGRLVIDGIDYYQGNVNLPAGRLVPPGQFNDGNSLMAELDGIGAGMGPSVIPYATLPVTTNPASWSCSGSGCSVVTGLLAPDGTATAGEIVSGSSGNSRVTAWSQNMATNTGDWFIYGAWVRPGVNNSSMASSSFGAMFLYSQGTDTINNGSNAFTSAFERRINGDWWHPVVAAAQITAGSSTAHWMNVWMYGPTAAGAGNEFWMPFVIYIPASAGVTVDEIERARQTLLHSVVPPGMPAGGALLAMNQNHKLYWGNDTNLYRGSAGVVHTDGSFDAGTAYSCNGSLGTNGQYLATTGTGCQWVTPPANGGIVAKVAPTTQTVTSSQSWSAFYTTPTGGQHVYQICMSGQLTATGSAGAYQVQVLATSNGQSNQISLTPFNVTSLTATSNASGCFQFVGDASTNVQERVYVSTSITGTPALQYAFTLSLLQ